MRRFGPTAILLLVALAVFLPTRSAAAAMLGDSTVPYAGDITVRDGTHNYAGKVFGTPGRMRLEHAIQGGLPAVILLQADQNRGWFILPGLRSFSTFDFPPAVALLADPNLLGRPVAQEMVAGRQTNRYRVDRKLEDGSVVRGTLNMSPEGILVRAEGTLTKPGRAPQQIGLQMSNLVVGPQSAALFEVPYGMHEVPPQALRGLLNLRIGRHG